MDAYSTIEPLTAHARTMLGVRRAPNAVGLSDCVVLCIEACLMKYVRTAMLECLCFNQYLT